MKIPSRSFRLTRLLTAAPREVEVSAWQAHVIKHPFGLGALYNLVPLAGPRRWNAEGWDQTSPPTLTREERAGLVARVLELEGEGRRCAAKRLDREEYKGAAQYERMPCYACSPSLAEGCRAVTAPVGERYASATARALEALEDGVEVPRGELSQRLFRSGELEPDAAVLSIGRLPKVVRAARVSVADGCRVELYLEGGTLSWRTTYRKTFAGRSDRINHLLDVLPPVPGAPLSDRVLVARRWWERNP